MKLLDKFIDFIGLKKFDDAEGRQLVKDDSAAGDVLDGQAEELGDLKVCPLGDGNNVLSLGHIFGHLVKRNKGLGSISWHVTTAQPQFDVDNSAGRDPDGLLEGRFNLLLGLEWP